MAQVKRWLPTLLTMLLVLSLFGCSGAEIVGGATAAWGAFMGYKKLTHPIKNAIVENPMAFWQVILAVIGLLTAIFTLAHKAGKDGKKDAD